jgi:hypothetical protein
LRCCIFLYVVTVLAHITLKFINDSLQQTKIKPPQQQELSYNRNYRTTATTAATRATATTGALQQQQQEHCSNSKKSKQQQQQEQCSN